MVTVDVMLTFNSFDFLIISINDTNLLLTENEVGSNIKVSMILHAALYILGQLCKERGEILKKIVSIVGRKMTFPYKETA